MATFSVMADRRKDQNDRKENGASGRGEKREGREAVERESSVNDKDTEKAKTENTALSIAAGLHFHKSFSGMIGIKF